MIIFLKLLIIFNSFSKTFTFTRNLTVPSSNNVPNYRIAIEAIVGKGSRGDVAIDEIVFYSNQRYLYLILI